ncbi:MAG: ABC transporter permease [Acidobacteriaceae bacterium]
MSRTSAGSLSLPLLLRRSLMHRRSRTLAELVALTVSAAVATALLTLYASLDLTLHHQFRAFGANIVITSKSPTGATAPPALPPNALVRAQQAAGLDSRVVPFAYAVAQTQDGTPIVVAGTDLAGVRAMNSWWQVSRWPAPNSSEIKNAPLQVLTGVRASEALGSTQFPLTYNGKSIPMETAGTLRTGDAEDSRVYLPLDAFEAWTGAAPTTLEIQAAGNNEQIQSVLAKLRQALPGVDVHAVHQLVDAEANVVSRTHALMLGSLLLISLTIAICVLATLTASVLERRRDFAVMKALGATQHQVSLLFLIEAITLALAGLVCGYVLGCGIAWLIGQWNFHTTIFPVWSVVPQVAILNLVVAILAAAVPLRILRRLEPATLLRGD